MCQLCSGDQEEVLKERKRLLEQASRLHSLARYMEQLAYGEIRPHDKGAKLISIRATAVIKELVEDWL